MGSTRKVPIDPLNSSYRSPSIMYCQILDTLTIDGNAIVGERPRADEMRPSEMSVG